MVEDIPLPLLIKQVFSGTQMSGMCWKFMRLNMFMSGHMHIQIR